jgi:hypothetical protein
LDAVKRVPFVDHTIVLDKHGYITEQGSFSALDAAGGYITNFTLGRPDTDIKMTMKHKSGSSNVQVYPVDKGLDTEFNNYRGNGDIAVYLYYVRSIGWLSTIFFVAAITGFIFCISFPSKTVRGLCLSYTDFLGQVSG